MELLLCPVTIGNHRIRPHPRFPLCFSTGSWNPSCGGAIILQLGSSRSKRNGPQRRYTWHPPHLFFALWQDVSTANLAPVAGSHRIGDDLIHDLCSRRRRSDSSIRCLAGPKRTFLDHYTRPSRRSGIDDHCFRVSLTNRLEDVFAVGLLGVGSRPEDPSWQRMCV